MNEETLRIKVFKVSEYFIKNQCYLAYRNGSAILVDPAWDFEQIDNFLYERSLNLQAVLLTHSHPDHVHLAANFSEKYQVPVYMSGIEIDFYNYTCYNLTRLNHLQQIVLPDFNIIPLLTAGHTKGSMCYVIEEHVFTGDTIFIEGVGICSGTGGSATQMYDSVQLLKRYLSNRTLFWPGHSFGEIPGKDLNFLLKNNIYFQLNERSNFIDFRMRKNQPSPFRFR